MSLGSARRAGAAAALTALALALAPAAPAGADPVITIDSPASGKVFDSDRVTVSGKAEADVLFTMREVTLSIGDQSTTQACTDTPCTFSWSPTIRTNGDYQVKVTAVERTVAGLVDGSATKTQPFKVAVPPRAPSLDPPQVTGDRTVALSWSRNTEPDMLYYAVFRADGGSNKFSQVGKNITQPTSGSKVTFTDTTTSLAGGDYTYSVVAVRNGPSGELKTPSKAASTSVPPPPTTSTAGPGSPQGGPTTTAKPGPPGGVDLNSFLSARAAPRTLTAPTTPEPPDTGFNETLPFGARPPGDDVEPGEAEPTRPGNRTTVSVAEQLRGGRPLVPVAAGLILLLLAMHVRLLNRRIAAAGEPSVDLAVDRPAGTAEPGVHVLDPDDPNDPEGPEGSDDDRPAALPIDEAEEVQEAEEVDDVDEAELEEVAAIDVLTADHRWAANGGSHDDLDVVDEDDLLDDDGVPVVVTAGGGRRDWGWDELEVREVVSPSHR